MLRFSIDTQIDSDIDTVFHCFSDPDQLLRWRPHVLSCSLPAGQAGESQQRLIVQEIAGQQRESIETVLCCRPPAEFVSRFSSNGGSVIQRSEFHELKEGQTLWCYRAEFNQKWFLKLLSFYLKGLYREAAEKKVEAFKSYVEAYEEAPVSTLVPPNTPDPSAD